MSVIAKRVTSRDEDEKRDSEPLMQDDRLRGETGDERKVKRAKPQRTSFKVVGHLVMAMKRFQDSLNPTYTYGKRTPTSSINQDGDTADDSVVSQPSPSSDDKKKGDNSYYSSRGHKTDLIFKSLPALDGERS
ncbi:hypothetical protein H632_c528p0 [Helicosporidium sp. ATCC 50920]|nr:hypothetical protein H632_c528p0 [Helicosporidium sp. ATCC 50920]|eukprot:KDD75724.1 hypothetical protein H632_c528p0 [Helicosporidium sp. ATCC 50920]